MTTPNSNIKFLIEKSVLASPPDLLFKIINSLDSELSSRQIGEIVDGDDQGIEQIAAQQVRNCHINCAQS